MAKVLKHSTFLLLVCLLVLAKASRFDHKRDEDKTKASLRFTQKQDDDESKIKLSLNLQHESEDHNDHSDHSDHNDHKFGRGRGLSGGGHGGGGHVSGGHGGEGGEDGCNCGDTKFREFMRKFMIVLKAYVSKEFIPDLQEMVAKMGHFVLEFMAKEKPEQVGKINKFLEHSAKVTSEAVAKHS